MKVPYYSEASELEFFGSVDLGGAWEFDIFAVFSLKETGELYYGTDAGCSCPCPFEDHDLEDLTLITGPQMLYGALNSWAGDKGRLDASDIDAISYLQRKVADYFRERRTREAG